jgi:DNA gyrase subunit A
LTENGWGKRTDLDEFRVTSRNTQGVWALAHSKADLIGKVVAARVVQPKDQITIITCNGIALRTPVTTISQVGRMTRGVRIVNLEDSDTVAAMARMLAEIEQRPHAEGVSSAGSDGSQSPAEPGMAEAEPVLSVVAELNEED